MKSKEIRQQKPEDTQKKMKELNSELIQLHGQSATGTPPKNPGRIKQIKRIIARVKTIQHEEELKELVKKAKLQNEKNKRRISK
ncbi:50S ribosomal protein L29 [Candidatus Woesearchaeota archaeon]|nr:50S ribosomal protein L29 [Candidatus Woesearchaeota archaeon]MCF7901669.1 50S ribosomal protein L29 [Candidatus Woesearchaeota archaeon]MCF8013343.1 50S ribosomal protein L29 [Candidatus Woesearchaeota archaeon]